MIFTYGINPRRKHPLIAVPFADRTRPAAIGQAKKNGMDIAELRIDLYSSRQRGHVLKEIKKFEALPTIATIRSKKEGGQWSGSERERLELFKSILPCVGAVDVELSSKSILKEVIGEARRLKKTVIVSYHNFKTTPGQKFLVQILKKAKAAGADVVKIAVMARSKKDLQAMADFTASHAGDKIITLSMGREGALSRILFPSLGSLLTFAHVGRPTAPGQMDLKTTAFFFQKLYA